MPDAWPLRGWTRHHGQVSKHMKGTACGRWGGGARRSKEEGLWGPLEHNAGFLIQHSLEGLPHPPRWKLGPLRTQRTLSSDRLSLSHQSQILSRPLICGFWGGQWHRHPMPIAGVGAVMRGVFLLSGPGVGAPGTYIPQGSKLSGLSFVKLGLLSRFRVITEAVYVIARDAVRLISRRARPHRSAHGPRLSPALKHRASLATAFRKR